MRNLNKKGSATDAIFVFILFFFLVFGALIFLNFLTSFGNNINDSNVADEAKDLITDFRSDIRDRIDNVIVFYFFLLIVGTWITSYFLDNHPMYFVIFIILSFISFFIVLPFANMAYNLQFASNFINEVQYLEKTFWIIEHTAAFLAFYIITTGIVLYAKSKFGNRQSYYG